MKGLTVNPRGSGPGFSMVSMEADRVGEAVDMLGSPPAFRREPQQGLTHTVVCWSLGTQAVCFESRFFPISPTLILRRLYTPWF